MRLKELKLTDEDRAELQKMVKKGSHWRQRERAQTVLYFGDGWRAKDIAKQQDLNLDTVYDRRKHWEKAGLASLLDKPRSGAPSKLNAAQKAQLAEWATNEALSGRDLLTRVQEAFTIVMHRSTLTGILKEMNFVWKRTRHDVKKSGMR